MWAVLTRGRIGETYLVGSDGERFNTDVLRAILRTFGLLEDDFDRVRDRPRPRPPLHHRPDQAPPRARLGAAPHGLRRGPRLHHHLVPRPRVLVVSREGGHRGQVRRAGYVTRSNGIGFISICSEHPGFG